MIFGACCGHSSPAVHATPVLIRHTHTSAMPHDVESALLPDAALYVVANVVTGRWVVMNTGETSHLLLDAVVGRSKMALTRQPERTSVFPKMHAASTKHGVLQCLSSVLTGRKRSSACQQHQGGHSMVGVLEAESAGRQRWLYTNLRSRRPLTRLARGCEHSSNVWPPNSGQSPTIHACSQAMTGATMRTTGLPA